MLELKKKYLTNSSADSISTLSTKICTPLPHVCLSISVDLAVGPLAGFPPRSRVAEHSVQR